MYLFQKKGTDLILDCRIYDVYQPSYVGSTKDKIVERIPRTKKIIYSNRDILGINDGKKGKDFKMRLAMNLLENDINHTLK